MSVKSTPEYYGLRPNVGTRVAVIDIGSNSVRLVVYEKNGRYPTPLFDERSNCQLGAQLGEGLVEHCLTRLGRRELDLERGDLSAALRLRVTQLFLDVLVRRLERL